MIVRTTRGQRFTTLAAYLLRGSSNTEERAAWTSTRNLFPTDIDKCARLMEASFAQSGRLKMEAGIKGGGRVAENPVYHLVLSWHVDDKPDRAHMEKAADSVLKHLKLDECQVALVAHADGGAPHLHLMINRMNLENGKLAPLACDRLALSKWAEAWAHEHNMTLCHGRAANEFQRQADLTKTTFVKHKAEPRRVHDRKARERDPEPPRPKVEPRQPNAELARLQAADREEISAQQRKAWDDAKLRQRAEVRAIDADAARDEAIISQTEKRQNEQGKAQVSEAFKPKWRQLFQLQRQEMRFLQKQATNPFERAVYVFKNRHRLGGDKPLTKGQMFGLIMSGGKLQRVVGQFHERQRKQLSNEQYLKNREAWRMNADDKHARLSELRAHYREKYEQREAVHVIELAELRERQLSDRRDIADMQKDEGAPPRAAEAWAAKDAQLTAADRRRLRLKEIEEHDRREREKPDAYERDR